MDTNTISAATAAAPSEVERAVAVIVLAFDTDPAARWSNPISTGASPIGR